MIREATIEDFEQIVKVHKICFPNSFSTLLGKNNNLLKKYYQEYFIENPELFLVYEEEKNIIGFCMGYYCEKTDFSKKFLKHNFVAISERVIYLLLIGNKLAWNKLKSIMNKKQNCKKMTSQYDNVPVSNRGDLLSICVLPEKRSKHVGKQLVEEYQNVLKKNGKKLCLLTVEKENEIGLKFYYKNGFIPLYDNGEKSICYVKELY